MSRFNGWFAKKKKFNDVLKVEINKDKTFSVFIDVPAKRQVHEYVFGPYWNATRCYKDWHKVVMKMRGDYHG